MLSVMMEDSVLLQIQMPTTADQTVDLHRVAELLILIFPVIQNDCRILKHFRPEYY